MAPFLIPWPVVSPTVKLALALLGLILIAVGSAIFLISPALSRTAALDARRTGLEREIAQARTAVTDLAHDRLERAEEERRLELIMQKLPTEREIPPLYRSLHAAAFSSGLAVALFQPRDPRIQDHYTEIPIGMTAEGTYHQLGSFLERVAGLSRVVAVGALKMTGIERPPMSLRAEMTLVTYAHRSVGTPPPPRAVAAKPPIPPAGAPRMDAPVYGSPPASSVRDALEPLAHAPPRYASRGRRDPFGSISLPKGERDESTGRRRSAIASAILTGIIRGPGGPLALVEMPDGIGYILRAGDGIDEGQLVQIRQDSVVFDVPSRLGLVGEQIVLALGPAK